VIPGRKGVSGSEVAFQTPPFVNAARVIKALRELGKIRRHRLRW
jgi:hypothetical protein